MKAARFYAAGDIRVEEVDCPQASDENVLVAVEWCGICGSDLNEYLGGPMVIPSEATGPHSLTGDMLPITMGHEFTGRVVHAPATSPFSAGQAVVADPRYTCKSCSACTGAASNCCKKLGFIGLSGGGGGGGGLSEVVAVSPTMLYPLPAGVDLAAASLIEPLAVGWHAVKRAVGLSGVKDLRGVPILLVGGGPVGVATIFALKAWGADTIFASEVARRRREFLTGLVTAIYNPAEVDVGSRCRELTGGDGVGIVFDCAGSQPGIETACDSLKLHGTYINLSIPKKPIIIPSLQFTIKEITFRSFLAYDEKDFEEVVIAFAAGMRSKDNPFDTTLSSVTADIDTNTGQFEGVERMITSRITVQDIVEKGFKELTVNPDDHVKIIATPKPEKRQSKMA